jgi:hypothetical protein
MITAADLSSKVTTQPFEPFRIVTSSGETYDVSHPEVIFVSKRVVYVGVSKDPNARVFDPVHTVSILHITALEPLPTASSRKRR